VTAEDAVERHLREIVGILTRYENWRYYRMDSAEKDLGENLSSDVDYAMFVTIGTSLFMGSTLLDKRLKSEKKNKEIAYRSAEFILVHSVEFLLLSDMILDVYTSVYRNKFEELRERRRREETVRPSEIAEIRKDLMYGLEEYNSISLFSMDPDRSIMEYGKKELRLLDKVDALKSGLQELDDMARTFYEENLSRTQVILTVLFGMFGVFQALEFLEPKIGLFNAIVTAFAIFLPYPIYKLLSYLHGRW
jgi:hypothetical protein